jgi:secreted trypsin-like serine protease
MRPLSLSSFAFLVVVVVVGGAVGCGASSSDASTGHGDDDIIGGASAADASLDAVGAIGGLFAGAGGTEIFDGDCTGTLIAPSLVLTAEHCLPNGPGPQRNLGFAVGPDTASRRIVRVTQAEAEQRIEGGGVGLGSDVAILHLQTPITDITPAKIGFLQPSDVDGDFLAVGYGLHDEQAPSDGVRRKTPTTLRAIEGKVLSPLVTFDEYHKRSGQPLADDRAYYDSATLLPSYEAVTSGPAQLCSGDSGGPLLKLTQGHLVVYGVASYVLSTAAASCDLGTVYATFGPTTATFINDHLEP